MNLRLVSKFVIPAMLLGAMITLLPANALAHCGCENGGGGVPEIGAGSAASALTVLSGAAYLLKERLFGSRNDKSAE